MLSTAHTILSLPLGVYLENPVIIFLAAAVLHLLADTILHWNIYPQSGKSYPFLKAFLDVFFGLTFAWLLLGESILTLPVLAAIAGGNFPDVLQSVGELASQRQRKAFPSFLKAWFAWHEKLQHETTSPALGLISQVAGVMLAIYLVWLV